MISDIKLVIWDLDETFWNGTLSEGPVEAISDNLERVKNLCGRGVMNSICSKNDFEAAESELERLGVWDFFLFPSIMWASKGQQVHEIIARMKLRPVNVLVVDDNALNREEIKFHNGGIHTLDPAEWAEIDISDWGKPDPSHKRLDHYRLLESKRDAAASFTGDNESFLRKSNIRCKLSALDLALDDMDRVVEVLNRTNQLNFTKRRFPSGVAQLVHELRRAKSTSYTVHVVDDYGDYGLCGFVSFSEANIVEDFAFSCRLLDMGVERAILQHLKAGHPDLDIPFISEIDPSPVDWVAIEEVRDRSGQLPVDVARDIDGQTTVLMPSACFSEVIAPFMQPEFRLDGLPDFAPLSIRMLRKQRHASVLYWSGQASAVQKLFDGDYDILKVFVSTEIVFPAVWLPVIGFIPLPITANTSVLKHHPDVMKFVENSLDDRADFLGRRLDAEMLRKIRFCLAVSKLSFVSRQAAFSRDRFQKNLNALRARLPGRTRLAISLCSEDPDKVNFGGPFAALNEDIKRQGLVANKVAREFVKTHPNAFLLEPVVEMDAGFNDMAGHYSHKQNFQYAQALKSRLLDISGRELSPA